MANYDSDLSGAQIESALEAINGLIGASNNGKIVTVQNGLLVAKSAVEIQGGTIDALAATENGTYTHSQFGGYSPVTVNVQPTVQSLSITENGQYTPPSGVDGYNQITVNVPTVAVIRSLSITENGTYTAPSGLDGYSPIVVNVPTGIVTAKAVIKATFDVGYVCTCSDGTTTFQSGTTGTYLFCLPNSGTWTLSCNGNSLQKTMSDYSYDTADLTSSQKLRVGGKIFYIDSSATGANYTFYDSSGNVISDVQVGDTPYEYMKTGSSEKDKYYVYYNSLETNKRWTYQENGSWVYNLLNTGTAIGTGKTNTATVIAADDGKYVTETTGGDTVWAVINRLRTSAEEGCDDWFVPSKLEVDALRTAVDRDGESLVSWFTNNYIWSSSEKSAGYVWYWSYNGQAWYDSSKNGTYGVFGVRAF